jgi:hypothetical protein
LTHGLNFIETVLYYTSKYKICNRSESQPKS